MDSQLTYTQALSLFTYWDGLALCLLLLCWIGVGQLIENPPPKYPSVRSLMVAYRRDWMREFVTRSPRVFDSSVLASLRQGTTFFASGCMIAIGGGLALIGNTDRLSDVAGDLALGKAPEFYWEIKLLLMVLLLSNGFLKFVWAHRLFGYCAVVLSSVPNDENDPRAYKRAAKAGSLNISGAKSYNRGMRSVYFALAAAAWLIGPLALALARLLTMTMLLRRAFGSLSRQALMAPED